MSEMRLNPDGLAVPAGAIPPPKQVIGFFAGGVKCYVNVAAIATLETYAAGNGWRVVATLTVTGRDGQPMIQPLTDPLPTEDECIAEMTRIMHQELPLAVVRPAVVPEPLGQFGSRL